MRQLPRYSCLVIRHPQIQNYRREGLYEKYLEPVAQLAEQLSEQGIDEEVVKEWQEFEVQFLP